MNLKRNEKQGNKLNPRSEKGKRRKGKNIYRLAPGFHRRVKAKTSLQDDDVPIDDTTTKPLFTPQEKRTELAPKFREFPVSFHVVVVVVSKEESQMSPCISITAAAISTILGVGDIGFALHWKMGAVATPVTFQPQQFTQNFSQYMETLDRSTIHRWVDRFQKGDFDLHDKERPGKPSTVTTDQNLALVEKLSRITGQ
ncbi:hypothetical protein LAZ67_12003489 [Cordylochernes scorpioides]|uniref:Uncharacterized protein n=1 Tax=Cordylochernes scorpioides TaxID=51811 RepID=A0ABY6L2X7_9ARAC|nr:hypothetical protein LAZ67_12003489 [Cordylochernes scorpioides]